MNQKTRNLINSKIDKDFYYYLKESSWTKLFLVFSVVFILINFIFALLFHLDAGNISGSDTSFLDSFFFSVQTISTIGYGQLNPDSTYLNILVTIESLVGMVFVALMTGLIFAKASRPKSNIVFSKPILIQKIDGQYHLVFRVGNKRGNDLIDANVSLSLLMDHYTSEGQHIRKIHDLTLVRNHTPFFSLSWFIMHKIDEESPIFDIFQKGELDSILAITALLTGHDGTYSQTVFARYSYTSKDILIDHQFEDVLIDNGPTELSIDFDKFHMTKIS